MSIVSRLIPDCIAFAMLFLLQEDASNITILGLLLECNLPKSLFNNPQVLLFPQICFSN